MLIAGIAQNQHFQPDPFQKTFIKDTHYQPDADVQTALRNTEAWQNFISSHGSWWVEFNESTGLPMRAAGKPAPTTGATNTERAIHFLQNDLAGFEIPTDQLTLISDNTSPKYHYVRYSQQFDGLAVLGSEAMVQMTMDNRINLFRLTMYKNITVSTTPSLSSEAAAAAAQSGITISVTATEVAPALKILPIQEGESGTIYHLVYEVQVHTVDAQNIPGNYYTIVDAHNGEVFYRDNRVEACGSYLLDADISVTNDVSLNPLIDPTSVKLPYLKINVGGDTYYTDAGGNLTVTGITGATSAHVYLDGLYAKVYQDDGSDNPDFTTTINPGTNNISFPASTNLSAVSAYYNQNRVHDYMKSQWPDYDGSDFDQRINTEVAGSCNAYYDGTATNFFPEGGGCPNTALFDDVVMHEYGHSLNYNLYNWLGGSMNNGSMQEGYADVWALCVTQYPVMGQGFFMTADTYVRIYDGTDPRVYPMDLDGEVHDNGEIIAGAWWDTGENMGSVDNMGNLWNETHYALIDGFDGDEGNIYRNVLLAALEADDDDGDLGTGTPNDDAIITAFAAHGITLLANAVITHSEFSAPLAAADPILIDATLDVDFPAYLGDFNLYYRTTTSGAYTPVLMSELSGDTYEGSIPAQPEGTIVEYYFKVMDIYGNVAAIKPVKVENTEPNLPYFLLVGYELQQTEDFDNTFGDWEVDFDGTDNSVTGAWDVNDPIQTSDDLTASYIIQTGADHTPGTGNLCAFTGNASPGSGIGTNDVDDGKTSIRSPFFDAIAYDDPVFTYYRWYSNDAPSSANPGNDVWQVYITNDGTTWKRVERTHTADNSWRRNAIRISDYVGPTDHVALLFVAQDSTITGAYLDGGSLVEAAVDDMMLYGKGAVQDTTTDTTTNAVAVLSDLFTNVYPNPVSETIHVSFSQSAGAMELNLVNSLGQVILNKEIDVTAGKEYTMDVRSLPAGIYSLTCTNNKQTAVKKILIE